MIISEIWNYFRHKFPYYSCPVDTWENPMARLSSHLVPPYYLLPDNKKEKRKEEKTDRKITTSNQINSI